MARRVRPEDDQPETYFAGKSFAVYRDLAKYYDDIFSGFTNKEFLGFNAMFPSEATDDVADMAIRVHLDRLKTIPKSRYLLFTVDAMQRARQFFQRLNQSSESDLLSKIQVISPDLPPYEYSAVISKPMTYFLGWTSTASKCVVYLYDDSVHVPSSVVVYTNNEVMHAILQDHFERNWTRHEADKVTVSEWFALRELDSNELAALKRLISAHPRSGKGRDFSERAPPMAWDQIAGNWNKHTRTREILDRLIQAGFVKVIPLRKQVRYRMTERGWEWVRQNHAYLLNA